LNEGYQRFGAAVAALDAELDWKKLGACYCEGDASSFFDDELRERMLDTGFLLADAIGVALDEDGPRRGLYVGAAVAELAPILAERLVLGREIVWLNLAGDETSEITRALRVVGERLGLDLPAPSTAPIESCAPGAFDHVWMVSVLTDPDAFPALHDHLYDRSGGPLATGRGSLSDEMSRANALIESWLDCAADTAILTTTDEELSLIEPAVRRRGGEWLVPEACHESAIVGDTVRMCRWSRAVRDRA
jgi:hypothetical protein